MRHLVIGASGLVGAEFARRARARGADVVGAARRVFGEATHAVDLENEESTARLVRETKPDVVVVCSAWPYVDGCEQDPARSHRENVSTVQNLVRALDARTQIVFYSTDHVFDGKKVRYVESDAVNPPSVYARHKREVEELLLARGDSLIVRTAWVFGEELRKKNFVYRVIDLARAGDVLKVPEGQAGCPTWSGWLTESTLTLLEGGEHGIVHLAGPRAFTKAEWAHAIVQSLGLPPLRVEESSAAASGQVAPRPDRIVLASERHGLVQPDAPKILADQLGRLAQR